MAANNIGQIKLPDNSVYNVNVPFVVGTGSTAGTWLGTLNGLTAYYDGLTILYKIPVAGASTTTLNLNSLGAKTVYLNSNSKLTTHFPVNQPVMLTYSTNQNSGCWEVVSNYDSGNTNTQLRVYRQTTGYNADYPILVSRTQTIGTAGTDGSYSGVYGVVHDTTQQPTVNPSTGEVKAVKFTGAFEGDLNGNAATATKLGTSTVGGTTTPIYLNAGVPTALSYTIAKSVPANAVFKDTNYYHTTGSWSGLTYTATANGGAGALAFTIPTGTSATTVAIGNHTHNYAGSSSAGGDATRALKLKDKTNNNDTYLDYGSSAVTWSNITYIGAWDGYTLRAMNKNQITPANIGAAPASHNQSADTITSGYLNIQPENSPILIPFMNNDLAYMITRGGSTIVKYDGTTQSVDISGCFDAGPGYGYAISNSGNYTSIVMELTLHQTFSWTNTIYVDFGSSGWRAKDVEIEVMNSNYSGDTWTSKYHNTSNTSGHCYVITSHTPSGASNAGGGFNKIRFTFKSFNNAIFRIAQLGVYNYGSAGLRTTYMSRGIDDAVWRSISPATTNKYNLGTSSLKWKDVYATTFHGALDGNASTATSATTASYANSINLIATNEIRLGNRLTSNYDVWINYIWADGTASGTITGYRFGNGNKTLTKVYATNFYGSLTGNVTGNCSGTSSNVTGTVAIANGGTGATTRLNALKALTNEDVGTNATYFLTITNSWGKGGYSSVANVKTVLGLKSAAYTESSAYLASTTKYAASSSVGGAATSAAKLTNTAKIGDTNKPVYFTANGVPEAISYTIDKSVPSNAKFTDTTYTATTTSIGSASAGTAIAADDITAWSAGTLPSLTTTTVYPVMDIVEGFGDATTATVSNGVLTITTGSSPLVSIVTAKPTDGVKVVDTWSAGTLSSLSYTARSIPNISVTSKTVATGITAS